MAQCVTVDATSGAVTATGTDPCTTFLLVTPAEYASWAMSPFNLTPEDGLLLTVAILAVWAVAFSFRALGKALDVDGEVRE